MCVCVWVCEGECEQRVEVIYLADPEFLTVTPLLLRLLELILAVREADFLI